MKKILTALVALSVVAGAAATSASAFDGNTFWQDYDRTHSNG